MSRVAQVLKSKITYVVVAVVIIAAGVVTGIDMHDNNSGHVQTTTNSQHQITQISYVGKNGQNARLTAKLTSWNIEIEKEETTELGFEEKVARAVQEIMTIQGIDRETAEGLVKGGFHSLEGLLAADLNDLTDILGAEKAAAAQQAANAEQERREAAQPPEGEPKA